MKDFIVKVRKLTDIDLLHKVASFTSGRESKMSLLTAYKTLYNIDNVSSITNREQH